MRGVLVDTSVWVDHFRHGNGELIDLLVLDLVIGLVGAKLQYDDILG
jgi:hypothetical protein